MGEGRNTFVTPLCLYKFSVSFLLYHAITCVVKIGRNCCILFAVTAHFTATFMELLNSIDLLFLFRSRESTESRKKLRLSCRNAVISEASS